MEINLYQHSAHKFFSTYKPLYNYNADINSTPSEFNNWVIKFNEMGFTGKVDKLLISQYEYFTDSSGNIIAGKPGVFYDSGINYICRFENLEEDFYKVCDKLKIKNITLPHLNKIHHSHYTDVYTDETRKIIENLYSKDIEHFGYKFGD